MTTSVTGAGDDPVVVQYVEPSMSDRLLRKFPDSAALGFDYSQSALWSPPVRRFHHLYLAGGQLPTPKVKTPKTTTSKRRLSLSSERRKRKITMSKIKRKIHGVALSFSLQNRRLNFDRGNDGGSGSGSSSTSRKGWEKVLKITSKQFKRKKKDPTAHVKLSDYLCSQNF